MRVLWIDEDDNPWTNGPDGWEAIEAAGVQVQRISSAMEARLPISERNFDVLLVRAELPAAEDILVSARSGLRGGPQRIVLTSSTWDKEKFRQHSRTPGAAHRYARVPMPVTGFLQMLADLMKCEVSALGSVGISPITSTATATASMPGDGPLNLFGALSEPSPAAPEPEAAPAPAPKRSRKKAPAAEGEGDDAEVLRQYLRIKEEQFEISEGERQELSRENERLQKEAQGLQTRLRELEHLHDELTKKIATMEEERAEIDARHVAEREENERNTKAQLERVKALETQIGEASERYENLRVRVRKDIRKIRENERDLEARLELTRKDSSTLLQARDEKVLELQRKIDALEFDLDQVQDSRVQAQMEAERYLARLSRVARALHIAVNMVEDDISREAELDDLEPLAGGAANAEELKEEPAAAAPPPADDASPDAPEGENAELLAALAADGEPTQMVSAMDSENAGGEPESNSG